MSRDWLRELADTATAEGAGVRVSVIRADGSAPRSAGSAMIVGRDAFTGTIGGGALEMEGLKVARDMLKPENIKGAEPWHRRWRPFPLGPSLGQCCGGYVELLFELATPKEAEALSEMAARAQADETAVVLRPLESGRPLTLLDGDGTVGDSVPEPVGKAARELAGGSTAAAARVEDWYLETMRDPRVPLFLFGAGHVGRAVVNVLKDLPFEIYWVDTQADRYPDSVPHGVHRLVSADPADAARHAPAGAWHVVMTYSHAIDFDVCRNVLAADQFGYLGLIASKTKRVRFRKRLAEAGFSEDQIARMHAPIGLPGLDGKEPATIAVSLAADLLIRLQAAHTAAAEPADDNARQHS